VEQDPAANAARQLLEVAHHRDGHDVRNSDVICSSESWQISEMLLHASGVSKGVGA